MRVLRVVLFAVCLGWVAGALAVDTSTCGALYAEQYLADHPCGADYHCFVSSEVRRNGVRFWCVYYTYRSGSDVFPVSASCSPDCNCAAQPAMPPAWQAVNDVGHMCVAGCTYTASGPRMCIPKSLSDPAGGQMCYSESGFVADGSNCDPVASPGNPPGPPEPPAQESGPNPPDPLCSGDKCLQPMTDPPRLCSMGPQGDRGCAPLPGPACGIGEGGYTCVGNPPPKPPDPPDQPPPPSPPIVYPPADFHPPGVTDCNGASCTDVGVDSGGPATGGGQCPEGSHKSGDNCVPDQTCADGSIPIGNSCPAPKGNCPDGTKPVAGMCPTGNGGVPGPDGCPAGFVEQNGQCYANCSDGSSPVNGMCSAPDGACPNGARPVDGRCEVGAACDPLVDPNQCGQGSNHAGGGETCKAAPFCSGDEALCAVLQQSWSTRCAVEALSPDGVPTEGDYGPKFTAADAWEPEDEGTPPVLDGNGWLGGSGTCPAMPSVSFMGESIDLHDVLPCDALQVLALLILLGGYVQAGFILGRA